MVASITDTCGICGIALEPFCDGLPLLNNMKRGAVTHDCPPLHVVQQKLAKLDSFYLDGLRLRLFCRKQPVSGMRLFDEPDILRLNRNLDVLRLTG